MSNIKQIPHDIEIEGAVLGAIMLESNALISVVDLLSIDSFYLEANKVVFKAILDLFDASDSIDIMTVTDRVRKNGDKNSANAVYITKLISRINSSANLEFHVRILKELYMRRELIMLDLPAPGIPVMPTENPSFTE